MVEDEGKQEEKFDFTAEGEVRGYISLAQARLLAMETAKESPGNYGRRFRSVAMAFDVVELIEEEDYYIVTLSFRPQGGFIGTPGREQVFITKEGAVSIRQVLDPIGVPRRNYRPFILAGVVLAVGAAAFIIATMIFGNGSEGGDSGGVLVAVPSPTTKPSSANAPVVSVTEPSSANAPVLTATGSTSISTGMRRGASISGTVTDAETGLPIANMQFGADLGGDEEDISQAETDDSGNYVFRGLPAGLIRVHVHERQSYIVQERDIFTQTVGSGEELEGVNLSFKRGATISGRVTDVDTGLPISDVTIAAERDREGTGYSDTQTGDDDIYTVGGLPPGDYFISTDRDSKGYIRELYDDKYAWEDGARVAVTGTAAVEGIDFGLKQGATIAGTVRDAQTGVPIANMDVNANLSDWEDISATATDMDGRYTLKGIPDGVIEVVVAGQGYLPISKTVTVQDGKDVTDFDF